MRNHRSRRGTKRKSSRCPCHRPEYTTCQGCCHRNPCSCLVLRPPSNRNKRRSRVVWEARVELDGLGFVLHTRMYVCVYEHIKMFCASEMLYVCLCVWLLRLSIQHAYTMTATGVWEYVNQIVENSSKQDQLVLAFSFVHQPRVTSV